MPVSRGDAIIHARRCIEMRESYPHMHNGDHSLLIAFAKKIRYTLFHRL